MSGQFLVMWLCFFSATAQNRTFDHYEVQHGIPSQQVYEAFVDYQGFLWFATSSGVSRYDGYMFRTFTVEDGLGDNDVFGFFEDSMNRLWFKTLNGKVSYYYKNKIHHSASEPQLAELDQPSAIRSISETPDGKILISHLRGGVTLVDPSGRARTFAPERKEMYADDQKDANHTPGYIGCFPHNEQGFQIITHRGIITIDSAGTVREARSMLEYVKRINTIRYHEGTIYFTDYKEFFVYNPSTGVPTLLALAGAYINGIYPAAPGFLWLCTTKGALLFNVGTNQVVSTRLPEETISSVAQDIDGNLWFTTLNHGVYVDRGKGLSHFDQSNGLSSNLVFSIDKDSTGVMWLGHDTYTLTRMDRDGNISNVSLASTPPASLLGYTPHIYEVNASGSELLVAGTPASFYVSGERAVPANSLNGKSIVRWKGDQYLVAGGSNGMMVFDVEKLKGQLNDCHSISELSHWRHPFWTYSIDWFTTERTNCLLVSGDSVWAGTDNGLYLLTGDSLRYVGDVHSALTDRIIALAGSGSTLFVGTDSKGVALLTPSGVSVISTKDGLSSNSIRNLQPDGDILWAGTNAGVNRIVLNDTGQSRSILVLNSSHGLPSDYIYDMLVDSSRIWFATSGGLSVLDKTIALTEPPSSKTYITSVSVNDQLIDTVNHTFDFRHNYFRIEYVTLSFKSKANIIYRYRLISAGNSADWQQTRNTSVDFSSLAPDNYTFQVMAKPFNGDWGLPVQYAFTISPPFWSTWWFTSLLVGLVSLLTLGVADRVRRRTKARREERRKLLLAELKSLRSQMNYHFMSNAFNSLQGLIYSEKNVDAYIGKFSRLMRLALENGERQFIRLSEEMEYMSLYADIENLRLGGQVHIVVEWDEVLRQADPFVPSMLIQPFVENAIWHGIMPKGEAGTIWITIDSVDPAMFRITIRDNGVGLRAPGREKKSADRKSHGIRLANERINQIRNQHKHIELTIEDLLESEGTTGTRVILILPLLKNEDVQVAVN